MASVVLCNGVFDVFHIGHLRYLEAASKMGAVIVSVTRDAFVNKGAGRPLYAEEDRLAVIRSSRFVQRAFLTDSSLNALSEVRPDIFIKGREYAGKISPEDEEYCRRTGITICFTDTETVRPRDRLRQS